MANLGKILQWNCRSITSKKSDLIYLFNKYKPSLCTLSETWLKPGFSFKIPGYSCLREDRDDGYGGVAILINNSFSFTSFPLPSHSNDISVVAALVNNICIVSVYFARPSVNILTEINNILHILPKPFLVMGDFNCQHQAWGSSVTSCYGEQLLDVIQSHNLCVLNTCLPTRHTKPDEGLSAPDLSISTPDLAISLDWFPLNSSYGSDHFPLVISFPNNNPSIPMYKPRIKHRLNNADWCFFSENVDQKVKDCQPSALDAETFAKILMEAADESFPLKNGSNGKIPSPPWWDAECSEAVKKRKEAERLYCDDMTPENFDSYLEISRITKKLLKQKKYESWQKFCASISPNIPPSVVWKNIRRFRSAFNDSHNPKMSLSLADEFMDHLAPPSVPEYSSISPVCFTEHNRSDLNSPFTLEELKGILSHVRDSAPGEDGIPYSFIVNLSDSTLLTYLELINSIVISGDIPVSWKSQTIIPILKSSKPSNDPSSYRPIALSSVLVKIAEYLVKIRLEWFIESSNLLSPSQFGFRKGRGTIDSLSVFTTDIRIAFSNNNSVLAAFLDIRSAYDSVLVSILKQKLHLLKVPIMLVNFIVNILSERTINVYIDDNKISRLVWRGLPQGSVLSPLLYNIYTHDLESALSSAVEILQYADDLLIYTMGHSIESMSSSLTSSLSMLQQWLFSNGLDLSVNKSAVVLFSRMRKRPDICVEYNSMPIPVKTQVKFLGVILDCHLTGLPHCEYIAAKCDRLLNIIRCLSGVWWGAHPLSLRLLYNALIRSVLDYGTFLLEPGSVAGFKKLDAVQSKALRIILGAMKSSPINCLQAECGEPPLCLRRQYLSDRFLSRCLQLSDHPLRGKLQHLSELVTTSNYWAHRGIPCLLKSFLKFNAIEAPCHSSTVLPIFNCNYNSLVLFPTIRLDLSTLKNDTCQPNSEFNNFIDNEFQGWHTIYTDASKHQNSCVGVGVFHAQYKIVQKIKLPPESSVYTGECFGLLRAVEYILLMRLPNTLILSDSLSSLQTLIKFPFFNVNQPIIFTIRELLSACSRKGLVVQFGWVPSHCGIVGNEKADRLANEAVECGDLFPFKNYCNDLATLPRVYLKEAWDRTWAEDVSKGIYYRRIQPSILPKPWFCRADVKLSKKAISVIIRMRLGHTSTSAHLAKLGIVQSPACACGAEMGDINHVLFSCPDYDYASFFASLTSLGVPFPSSASCLLSNFNVDIYKCIAKFLTKNDVKI